MQIENNGSMRNAESLLANVAVMMMVSMHTMRYNTSISPLLHVVRSQLHPLDAIVSHLLLRIIITSA